MLECMYIRALWKSFPTHWYDNNDYFVAFYIYIYTYNFKNVTHTKARYAKNNYMSDFNAVGMELLTSPEPVGVHMSPLICEINCSMGYWKSYPAVSIYCTARLGYASVFLYVGDSRNPCACQVFPATIFLEEPMEEYVLVVPTYKDCTSIVTAWWTLNGGKVFVWGKRVRYSQAHGKLKI